MRGQVGNLGRNRGSNKNFQFNLEIEAENFEFFRATIGILPEFGLIFAWDNGWVSDQPSDRNPHSTISHLATPRFLNKASSSTGLQPVLYAQRFTADPDTFSIPGSLTLRRSREEEEHPHAFT